MIPNSISRKKNSLRFVYSAKFWLRSFFPKWIIDICLLLLLLLFFNPLFVYFFQICWANTISASEEWSSIGKEANGGVNNNEATNNLHLLASAGLDDLAKEDSGGGLEDADSNTSTPRKRKRSSDDNNTSNGKMQTDVVRVPGLSQDLQQQITKFDSSEFDVSITNELQLHSNIKGQKFLKEYTPPPIVST